MTQIPLIFAGLSRAGSPPSWRKGSFRKRNPTGTEVPGQQLLLCLAIPAGCNSVNTPNNEPELENNWRGAILKAGLSQGARDRCGTATAPPMGSVTVKVFSNLNSMDTTAWAILTGSCQCKRFPWNLV